jgi:hypothetical protein
MNALEVVYTENKIETTYGDLRGLGLQNLRGVLGFRVAKCKRFRGCKIGYCTLIFSLFFPFLGGCEIKYIDGFFTLTGIFRL